MKKFFCQSFLLFNFFCAEVFSQDQNVSPVKKMIEENPDKLSTGDLASQPRFSVRTITDIRFDDNYQATDRKDEFKESKAESRIYAKFNFNKNFFIDSYFRLTESNQASEVLRRDSSTSGSGDRAFENEGVVVRELNLGYQHKNMVFIAGKFDLDFGTAWQWNRGIWTYEIADDYRHKEKLGFNAIYRLGDAKTIGEYEFSAAVFTNDRKNFDNATITGRDSDHKSDARPGDTRSLKSFVTLLNVNYDFGGEFNPGEKLSYHFGYVDLAVNDRASSVSPTKIDDQKSWVAGMNYKYPLAKNFLIDALIEYNDTKNFGGDSDIGEKYFTANLINRIYQNWNVTLAYAELKHLEVDAAGFDKNFAEISFGYDFKKILFFDRITLQSGYKNLRTDYKTSLETQNVFGALVRFYKNF